MDNGTHEPDRWLTKPLVALMALAAVVAMSIADPGDNPGLGPGTAIGARP